MGWYIYETVKNLKMRKKQTHMGVKNKQWHPVRNLMLFLLTVVRLYLNWPPKFKEIWGRGMVTNISDVVHGEPVPLILPHPGLPVDFIGSFLFVWLINYCQSIWFGSLLFVWWTLACELWAWCCEEPCCGWTAQSWLASPNTGIPPATNSQMNIFRNMWSNILTIWIFHRGFLT